MIHLESGERMANTDEQINRMLRMAKRLYQTDGREEVLDMEDEESRAFITTILEERPVAVCRKEKAVFEEDVICLTGVGRCESSMITLGAKVRTKFTNDLLAFHMLAFTYNDDGILKPVGLSQTVMSAGDIGELDILCKIRKLNIDSRTIGAMMTFIKIRYTQVAAMAKIELLNQEMEGQRRLL